MTRFSDRLALALVDGARAELELTPKPGLVDRLDNGSHPDLSFEAMGRSIALLPLYFDALLDIARRAPALDLAACVQAGVDAEARMAATIGSNAHRGYIFLGGLVLLGATEFERRGQLATVAALRAAIRGVASRVLGSPVPRPSAGPTSNGAAVRQRHALGGIHREALEGLPSVFDVGLPVCADRLKTAHPSPRAAATGAATQARHYLMAVLMQSVEDTTAVHRCGPAGLARLRTDGARLQHIIEQQADYQPYLRALNDEYRAMRLTMGGVADCLAICLALHEVELAR
ncbi:MAG TPA: triphosphoribosyl-dephospho-CoA synthase [Vicinamibacterales bacterium]|jgi:triphosphoribosyl-dephospho-CoA synthase